MNFGLFSKLLPEKDPRANFSHILETGYSCTQFNFSTMGLPTVPEAEVDILLCRSVRNAQAETGISIPVISGTCNLIAPDTTERKKAVEGVIYLIAACERMGIPRVSLCTGTRDTADMWKFHPDNASPEAWSDLEESLSVILDRTAGSGVSICIEPEKANVVSDPRKALELLKEMGSKRIELIFDAANILSGTEESVRDDVLKNAFGMLREYVSLFHMKEIYSPTGIQGGPTGSGLLNIPLYISLIRTYCPDAPVFVHGLNPSVSRCMEQSIMYLKQAEGGSAYV